MMVMELVVSVIFVLVGIAVLVTIHVCMAGRAFGFGSSGHNNSAVVVIQRSTRRRSPRMSQEDIKKLPCFEYEVEEGKGNGGPMEECAVCLESFKAGDTCRLLPNCRHNFHAQCIGSWLSKTAVCPICRTTASSQKIGEFSNEVGLESV